MNDSSSESPEQDIVPYPPDLVAVYRGNGLWRDCTISEAFSETARRHAERPAVRTDTELLTYAELDRRSDLIAFAMHEMGLRSGERVLLQVGNHAVAVVAWYGILKAGLVPIATLPHHREHEILAIAAQSEPTAHLVDAAFPSNDLRVVARNAAQACRSLRILLTVNAANATADAVALESLERGVDPDAARDLVTTIQSQLASDSLAVLQLSGGTTSVPKLIPRLHAEYWYNSQQYAMAVKLTHTDCVAHILPLVHNAGVVCAMHAAHAVGACLATCSYEAAALESLARRECPTHIFMAPPIAQMVLGNEALRQSLIGVQTVVWTLGKLPDAVREAFETPSCRIQQLYGQGEGLCMVTPADAPVAVRHESVGAPISSFDEVRILAPGSEDPVPVGEPGELCCRGPYTTRGYYRGGQRNIEAFTSNGFYRTGDIAVEKRDAYGTYYAIEDRLKDVISRGGEKINALEVERLLTSHPDIRAAALVAMPDERLGERACAIIVLEDFATSLELDDVRRFLDGRGVAKFKWPERIELRECLPVTNINKVNKAILRREIATIVAEEKEKGGQRDQPSADETADRS